MSKDAPQLVRPYLFHGVDLDYANKHHPKEAVGTCPFCDKEDHFYVNKSKGLFDCKRCGEKGNVASFLSKLHELALSSTTAEDYAALAEERAIPESFLKAEGYAVSPIRGKWLIPVYNSKGKLANLLLWLDSGPMGTPTCNIHLIGAHEITKDTKVVWLVEGPWDRTAWKAVLGRLKRKGERIVQTRNPKDSIAASEAVVAAPGSGTFKTEWAKLLADKEVRILYDNDHPKKNPKTGKTITPGWEGTERTASLVVGVAESVDWLRWGPKGYTKKLPSGYDLRDLQRDRGVAKAYTFVAEKLEEAKVEPKAGVGGDHVPEGESIEPLPRTAFAELCEDFESVLHFTPNVRDTLSLMLATIASTTLDGDQLWLRVIGPPGSGKSTLSEAILAASDHVIATDILTGLASGFVSKQDASLIDQFRDKTIVIHDGDTLVNAPNRDAILRELRAFYGRSLSARYRNRQTKIYHGVNTTWIVCGTDTMRDLNRTFLGERFLDVEILGDSETQEYLRRSRHNTYARTVSGLAPPEDLEADGPKAADMLRLKAATKGYIIHVKETLATTPAPRLSDEAGDTLEAYGEFLSYARTRFEFKKEDYDYRPRKELGTRLVSQFTKLAISLAVVLGKRGIDEEVLRLVRKVVLDSAHGYQLEIIEALTRHPYGLSASQLSTVVDIPETTTKRILSRMQTAKIVTRRSVANKSGQRGRNAHMWILTKDVLPLSKTVWKPKTRKRNPKPRRRS